jgi:FtsH-binding integral membrane protein
MASIDINSFFNALDRKLEPHVKTHLKHVYGSVAMALMASAIGSWIHLNHYFSGGLLSALAAIGFGIALISTPDNTKNRNTRLSYLLGFAAASGLNLGPLLEVALFINPTIVTTALISSCVIFGCFSLSAIFSEHRKWLYLSGTLSSALSLLLMMSLVNLFIGSQLLFQMHLYLGFLVICVFIMYDTALIIEKRRIGDTDYIWHSVLLFVDFMDLFRHLLVILMQKEQNKNRKKK